MTAGSHCCVSMLKTQLSSKKKKNPKSSSWRGNNRVKLHCVQCALQWKSLVEAHHAEDKEELNVSHKATRNEVKKNELDYIMFIQIAIQ